MLASPLHLAGWMGSLESSLEVAAALVEEAVAGGERRLGSLDPLTLAGLAAGAGWLACSTHRAWQECEEGVLVAARARLLALARCCRVVGGWVLGDLSLGGWEVGEWIVGDNQLGGWVVVVGGWVSGWRPPGQAASLGGEEDPEGAGGEHGRPAGGWACPGALLPQEGMEGQLGGVPFLTSLPTEGWTREQVVGEVTSMLGLANFKAPSGVCHKPEQQRVEVVTEVPHCTAATVP